MTMRANILIVEDEYLVALQLEDMLLGAGHCVLGIVSDHASLASISGVPQVALVDLNLRDGPSGPMIALDLAHAYGTKVVYVTANPQQIDRPAPTAIGVVQKPFSEDAILAAVTFALNGQSHMRYPSQLEPIAATRH
jgi:DNA-binding response OmpR family regulator